MPLRERARLVVAERLKELEQSLLLIRSHDPTGASPSISEDIRQVESDTRSIKKFVKEHEGSIPKRPSFTKVLAKSLGDVERPGSLAVVPTAAYSAVAHAVPDMMFAFSADDVDAVWDSFRVGAARRKELVLDLVMAVSVAYVGAVNEQIQAYGWPPSSWKRSLSRMRREFRQALAQTAERRRREPDANI